MWQAFPQRTLFRERRDKEPEQRPGDWSMIPGKGESAAFSRAQGPLPPSQHLPPSQQLSPHLWAKARLKDLSSSTSLRNRPPGGRYSPSTPAPKLAFLGAQARGSRCCQPLFRPPAQPSIPREPHLLDLLSTPAPLPHEPPHPFWGIRDLFYLWSLKKPLPR